MIVTTGMVFGVLTIGSTLWLVAVAEKNASRRRREEKETLRKYN